MKEGDVFLFQENTSILTWENKSNFPLDIEIEYYGAGGGRGGRGRRDGGSLGSQGSSGKIRFRLKENDSIIMKIGEAGSNGLAGSGIGGGGGGGGGGSTTLMLNVEDNIIATAKGGLGGSGGRGATGSAASTDGKGGVGGSPDGGRGRNGIKTSISASVGASGGSGGGTNYINENIVQKIPFSDTSSGNGKVKIKILVIHKSEIILKKNDMYINIDSDKLIMSESHEERGVLKNDFEKNDLSAKFLGKNYVTKKYSKVGFGKVFSQTLDHDKVVKSISID